MNREQETSRHRSPLVQAAEEQDIVTPDKPDVALVPPQDRTTASGFLNIRVADIASIYRDWSARGARFLTEPVDNHGTELRCYLRDPDGYLIEVGQTLPARKA
jgi:catechol 2,3-dioxygenase-like lactoylglutathione lyase family enzyme